MSEQVDRAAGAGSALLTGGTFDDDLAPAARAILQSALTSFAIRGFHATTLRHIAAGSGLSTAALYVHFRSKDDVLSAISARGHRAALDLVGGAAALGPADHAFRTLVYTFSRWHAEQRTVARVVQYELDALAPDARTEVDALRRTTERVVRGVVAAALDGPAERDGHEVRGITTAVLSLGIDVARWYRPGGPYTPDGVGRLHCDLASRMVGPAPGVNPAR